MHRYLILASFCILSCSNASIWMGLLPVSTLARKYFPNVSIFWMNAQSTSYMVLYCLSFFSSVVMDRYGLRAGLLIGSFLNFVGSLVRLIGVLSIGLGFESSFGFGVYLMGQCGCAVAQTFILQAPPKISNRFFPMKEQSSATSIGTMGNLLGTFLAFLLCPLIVQKGNYKTGIILYISVQFFISSGAFLGILFFMENGEKGVERSFSEELKGILNPLMNVQFLVLSLSFSLCLSSIWTLQTLLDELVHPLGYNSIHTGVFGASNIGFGMVGGLMVGFFMKYFHRYRFLYKCFLILNLISCIAFVLLLFPRNFVLLVFSNVLIGFSVGGIIPIAFELSIEVTYPSPEASVAGFQMILANVFAVSFISFMSYLVQEGYGSLTNWTLVAINGVASVLGIFFYGEYRRRKSIQMMECISDEESNGSDEDPKDKMKI